MFPSPNLERVVNELRSSFPFVSVAWNKALFGVVMISMCMRMITLSDTDIESIDTVMVEIFSAQTAPTRPSRHRHNFPLDVYMRSECVEYAAHRTNRWALRRYGPGTRRFPDFDQGPTATQAAWCDGSRVLPSVAPKVGYKDELPPANNISLRLPYQYRTALTTLLPPWPIRTVDSADGCGL